MLSLAFWGTQTQRRAYGMLTSATECWPMISGICARVVDAPVVTSQLAIASPFGKDVSTLAVTGLGRSLPTPIQLAVAGQGGSPRRIQAECRWPAKMRPPLSA